jgi:peroxiredoxin
MRTLWMIFFSLFVLTVTAKIPNKKAPPVFSLKDINGNTHKIQEFHQKTLVLEWHNPKCPFSKRHTVEKTFINLQNKYLTKDVDFLAIDSSNPAVASNMIEYYAWIQKHGVNYPILQDPTGIIGKKYDARVTPHIFIIHKGILVYQGAVDDDTFGEKPKSSRKNYVDMALSSLTINGSLPKGMKSYYPEYGCGIKY